MKALLCAASIALATTACTQNDQPGVDINRPIDLQLTPSPAATVQTKAAIDATAFDADDVVGLYQAWTAGATTETPIANALVSNTGWSNGAYTGEALYWQNTTDVHTLYAYYPYHAQLTGTDLPLSLQADQQAAGAAGYEQADVLWGKCSSKARNSVSLTLDHCLSRVTIRLEKGAGYAETEALPDVQSVELLCPAGFLLSGNMNLGNGQVSADAADAQATALTTYANRSNGTYYAILLPGQKFAYDADLVRITTQDGTTYTYRLEEAAGITTAPNTTYDLTLKLNKGSVTLTSTGLHISPWGTAAPINGEADMDIPSGN